jgi:hypothetical protein
MSDPECPREGDALAHYPAPSCQREPHGGGFGPAGLFEFLAGGQLQAVVMRPEPIIAILTHLALAGPQASPRPPPEQLSLI